MRDVAIHQFVPSYAPRDAIGSHTWQTQRVIQEMGIHSDVYCIDAHGEYRKAAKHYEKFRPQRGENTRLLYQMSTGSKMADWLLQRTEPLVIDYHNITPHEYFAPWEGVAAMHMRRGRRQLRALQARTEAAFADSEFNRNELDALGYQRTSVVPILFDTELFRHDVDEAALERLKNNVGSNWLFVGRIAPNKCQHDLIKALAAYRKVYDPNARLHLVGASSAHAYETTLHKFAEAAGLGDAVNFAGSVSAEELSAYYEAADVFVCASEHEGFLVPVLEAMYHKLPIVAYYAGAVPETINGAGVVVALKDPQSFAGSVARVLEDQELQTALERAAVSRLADFSLEHTQEKLRSFVRELVE